MMVMMMATGASAGGDESTNNIYEQPRSGTGSTQHRAPPPSIVVQRCVVIAREADGYGLTVTGDHPVFVQTVKSDGAAYRSGIRQGDRILKVNGMPVNHANHLEVVRMISNGQTVALTLLGAPPEFSADQQQQQQTSTNNNTATPFVNHRKALKTGFITSPRPLSSIEEREEWRQRRALIIRQMLDEERRHVEQLRANSTTTLTSRDQLDQAERRLVHLQSQLQDYDVELTTSDHRRVTNPPVTILDQTVASNMSSSIDDATQQQQQQAWMGASGMHFVPPQQVDIAPMEDETDDEDDADSLVPLDTQGPFSNLVDLKSRPAHLAVFINFLLGNGSPNSLFFYLIADCYQNASALPKEQRKWAYEIFSTFLIPNSPLNVPNIDQSMVQTIDKVLSSAKENGGTDHDDQQVTKRLFIGARQVAVDDINEQLSDFRQKRQIGLGSIFDMNLLAGLTIGDRAKELKIADTLLMPPFERLFMTAADFDALDNRTQAIVSSLATIIKLVIGLRPSCNIHEKLLDKCPTFVAKCKGGVFKIKSMASKRSMQVKGHQFLLNPVAVTIYCYHCRDPVWGVNAQAYFCTNCDVVLHKQCTGSLVDHCYPVTQLKTKSGKPNRLNAHGIVRDSSFEQSGAPPDTASSDLKREDMDKTTDLRAKTESINKDGIKSISSDSGIGIESGIIGDRPVSRSHSMRSKTDDNRDLTTTTKRDRSTFSWGDSPDSGNNTHLDAVFVDRQMKSDTDEHRPLTTTAAVSIVRIPSEMMVGSVSGSSSISHASIGEDEARRMLERVEKCAVADGDSDLEVDTEVPSIESIVDWEVLRHLKPKEKKRQEVINELFHTERTHVRNLKIIYHVFYTPMLVQKIIPPDFVKLLFANIEEVLEMHDAACKKMRLSIEKWRVDSTLNGLYGDIGPIMLEMFDGDNGQRLKDATSTFCQHQQYALDMLKQRIKKDEALCKFLTEAECNVLCRKLQLKDMLPVEMQRLVKYPLLLETILKYTSEPSDEHTMLRTAVQHSRSILSAVNSAKRNAENLRRLDELQRRLDTTPFDRENFALAQQYRALDLRKYTLIHDGPLTWRFSRGKMVELHVVLLENLLVLLTKHSGSDSTGCKLVLRCQEPTKDTRWMPILPLGPLIAKEKANDKKAFFIVNNSPYGAQIYELVASTATERKTWFKLISEQMEIAGRRGGSSTIGEFGFEPAFNDSGLSEGDDDHHGRVRVLTHPHLVNANEIEIQQATILEHAEPVLTPTERLRRNDDIILKALMDKQRILVDLLPDASEKTTIELDRVSEALAGLSVAELKQRDTREVAVAAIVHGNRLLDAINAGMNIRKQKDDQGVERVQLVDNDASLPSVACYRLTGIAAPLMNHLKAMMQVVNEQQEELKTIKAQLYQYKELSEQTSAGRSTSEETLTESTIADIDSTQTTSPNSDETDKRRRERIIQKRQRNTALVGAPTPPKPPPPPPPPTDLSKLSTKNR